MSISFRWNDLLSDPCPSDVGVGQGSALSPILSNLAIAPILHVFSLSLPGPTHLAISLHENVGNLRDRYATLHALFRAAGFLLEDDKLELMHFPLPRTETTFPPFRWQPIPGGPTRIYLPNTIWRYLGFYFDRFLTFRHHIKYYATRALSTVRSYPLLGNANRGLSPLHKRQLYISCVLPLLTYGMRLWFNPHKAQTTLLKPFRTAQAAAAKWILGTFRTSPHGGMDVLAGLLPIRLHLRKLYKRSHLRVALLPSSHILKCALPPPNPDFPHAPTSFTYSPILRSLPTRTQPLPLNFIASSLTSDIPAEDFLPEHAECRPGDRLVDTFPDSFIFHTSHPKKSSNLFNQWLEQFRDGLSLLRNDDTVLYAFSDGSVLPNKRNRAAAAYRAYRGQQELYRKSISCGRTTSYDAELQGLFLALHYLTSQDATAIYLFCDNESALTSLFDTRLHASQMLSVLACRKARAWLEADPNRTIHLSWCPGHADIEQNEQVDVDAKTAATTTPPSPSSHMRMLGNKSPQKPQRSGNTLRTRCLTAATDFLQTTGCESTLRARRPRSRTNRRVSHAILPEREPALQLVSTHSSPDDTSSRHAPTTSVPDSSSCTAGSLSSGALLAFLIKIKTTLRTRARGVR
ncbi:hypothetical protein EVG20_g2792 [Dentipellis fragilis]|uniref:RNase H type-1 domain-containing protein n=1 Tax=Dentipellis fragilis TaxID=205917 RepID=A0A4Y9Z5R6_9AGAM|nr:hypothetical protein EVG20_g2792 [Dentipellis fragilis]